MAAVQRRIEVFTAGCLICDETVGLVKSPACPSCEVQVYDLREGCAMNECWEKARRYGGTAVPAVAVDGALLNCCRREPIAADHLRAVGIGQP
jgi:hypothetical protein